MTQFNLSVTTNVPQNWNMQDALYVEEFKIFSLKFSRSVVDRYIADWKDSRKDRKTLAEEESQ